MLGVLAACGTQDVGLEESSVELLVRDTAVSTSGTELEATIVSGEAYIVADTRPVATRVSFYIDDVTHAGTPVKVDEEAPFDMVLDTRSLVDGEHTVTAVVVHARKRSESTSVVTTTFTVHNAPEDGTPGGDPIDSPEPSPDSGWQSVDVIAALPGTTVEGEGTVVLQASGADVWGTSDSFRFHYMQVVGDFDLVTKVLSMTEPDSSAKAGLMIRAALAPESRNSFMYASVPSRQRAQFSVRAEDSGQTVGTPSDTEFPMYLRLSRRGEVVYGFTSVDGVAWHMVSEASIALPETALVGLAATSRTDADHVVATFETPEFVTLPNPEPDPVTDPEPEPEPQPEPSDPGPGAVSTEFSLRGDPSFEESQLSSEARMWYRRFLAAMEHPDQKPNGNGQVWSGSLREYGYSFQQYMMYLFTAVRATGDLRLVDEIARLGDIMASKLTSQWYDPVSGSWYTPTDGTDGYRRWVYLRANDTHHRVGKDTDRLSAYKTHATVALMAYTFEVNRDLASPSGVDYGAKADFWMDYLVNDFEAIWRMRENTSSTGDFFEYSDNVGASTLHSQLTYHYYMHKLTGQEFRREHADREAATIAEAMYVTETPLGPAMIFSHRIRHHEEALSPVPYVRYVYPMQIDLALEGHPTFSDPEYMEMHARAFGYFVMDNGSVDLSFDIGGMRDRTGTNWLDGSTVATIRTKNPWDTSSVTWERQTTWRAIDSFLTPIGAFGESDRIGEIALSIYRDRESDIENPRGLAVPLGMLLTEVMK